jgi:hypothetical protein
MKSNHNPSLQDRLSAAAQSRQKALDNLRSKPPVDEKIVAARQEARLKREAAQSEKRAAKAAEEAAAAELKAAEAARAKAFAAPPTAAEMKAARDARYAARKTRK